MTYLPSHFQFSDRAAIHGLVQAQPLGTWVVPGGDDAGELLVNHIPFWLDPDRGEHGTLLGHVARANPVWRALGAAAGVVVFHGPQAYISPNWYPSKHENGKAVPTWNYSVVHAHGVAQTFDDPERLLQLLHRLTDQHEADQALPWKVSDAPTDYLHAMLGAIVGIEIPVQRWVGKNKASQNRSAADRRGVAAGLCAVGSAQAVAAAALVPQDTQPESAP